MKDVVLLELAGRWEREAKEPNAVNGSDAAKLHNATAQGAREAKRGCADALRMLVKMLGDPEDCLCSTG